MFLRRRAYGFMQRVGSNCIQTLQCVCLIDLKIWKITKIWAWHKFILLKLIPRSSRWRRTSKEAESLSLHWSSSLGGLTIIACINAEPREPASDAWGPEMFNCLLYLSLFALDWVTLSLRRLCMLLLVSDPNGWFPLSLEAGHAHTYTLKHSYIHTRTQVQRVALCP